MSHSLIFFGRAGKKIVEEHEKGALYFEYNILAHQFIAHLRSVHRARPDIMDANGIKGKVLVKVADPLARPLMPL